jgi:hypothetical protein
LLASQGPPARAGLHFALTMSPEECSQFLDHNKIDLVTLERVKGSIEKLSTAAAFIDAPLERRWNVPYLDG